MKYIIQYQQSTLHILTYKSSEKLLFVS